MTRYERLLNDQKQPTENEILSAIRSTELWKSLREYLDASYDIKPEVVFYGKKYGWTIRYRKSGKTLCSLFPEQGAFTVLVVLGGKEIKKAEEIFGQFSAATRTLIKGSEQLHDGKWLWIRVTKSTQVDDVKRLLALKRKPVG